MAISIPGFNACYVFRHQLVTEFTGKNLRKDSGKKIHETIDERGWVVKSGRYIIKTGKRLSDTKRI